MIAVYEKGNAEVNGGNLSHVEAHLYGSGRLGIYNAQRNVENPTINSSGIYDFERGYKVFELSNHLGNVLLTITDRKLQVSSDNTTISYYATDIVTATDYSTFGTVLAAREYNSIKADYGFNGQLKDKEIHQDHHTALFWEYDPRIARRWNVDPVPKSMVSPYACLGGNPIMYVDPLGNDWYKNKKGKVKHFEGSGTHKGWENITGKWVEGLDGYSFLYGHDKEDITVFGGPEFYLKPVVLYSKSKTSIIGRSQWGRDFDASARRYRKMTPFRDMYTLRRRDGLPIVQAGDPAEYTDNLKYLETSYKISNAFREGGAIATGFFLAPFATMFAVESGAVSYTYTFLKQPFLAATGRYGQIPKVIAWMKMGNAASDLTYQTIKWSITGESINPASTLGNLYLINPALSSLPGSVVSPEGNFFATWGRNATGDAIGNIPIPGMKFGARLGMEGFTMPLFGNLTSDVIFGQYK